MPMHPARRQRLYIILFMLVLIALAAALAGYALRENINLFYPPAAFAAQEVPVGKRIRAGGMVVRGSVQRDPNSLKVSFAVTDYESSLNIRYEGILPDMFAEGEGAVATGTLAENGEFIASEVLAKHDENYMPPEIAESLKAQARDPDSAY